MATFQKLTVPSSLRIIFTRSYSPMDTPPEVTTTSASGGSTSKRIAKRRRFVTDNPQVDNVDTKIGEQGLDQRPVGIADLPWAQLCSICSRAPHHRSRSTATVGRRPTVGDTPSEAMTAR